MNAFRSIGAGTTLVGMAVTIIGAWVGVWAVMSSNFEWLMMLAVGLLLTLAGAMMLTLAWLHDKGEAQAAAKAAKGLRESMDLLDEFVERGGHAWRGKDPDEFD